MTKHEKSSCEQMREHVLEVLDEDEWMSMSEISKAIRKKHPRMFQYSPVKSYDTLTYDSLMKLHLHGKIEVVDDPIRARLMAPDTQAQIEFVQDSNFSYVIMLTPRQAKEAKAWLDHGGHYCKAFIEGLEE